MLTALLTMIKTDHCRIGSLEMDGYGPATTCEDHCRIGSLENLVEIW